MDVQQLVEETVNGLNYELVDLERVANGLLRVFIDKPEGITHSDCKAVSDQLSRVFMVEGVDYQHLEVSSPGLDRPLKKAADYERFAGKKASVKLRMPMEGRKKFIGIIAGLADGVVQLEVDGSQVSIELANVDKARLVPEF